MAHEDDLDDSQARLAHDLRCLIRAEMPGSSWSGSFRTFEVLRGSGFRAYVPKVPHQDYEDRDPLLGPLGAYLEAVRKGKEEVMLSVEEFEDLVFVIGKWKGVSMTGFTYSNPVTDVDVSEFWEMAEA
ncbi:hypothetical protein LTR37_007161 [Vermiconidia calcicola]|uniref:Uncharacterized protein n=1 Tax=Vermiconidia calcicola TaxID=1690605 RepID=A0ACC3NER1_9PEZI|nr:hypothetical protein LTR37_007161 [Vermiconidia calcicola]